MRKVRSHGGPRFNSKVEMKIATAVLLGLKVMKVIKVKMKMKRIVAAGR